MAAPPTIRVQSDSAGTDIQTLPVVGQKVAGDSLPVVLASDTGGVPSDAAVPDIAAAGAAFTFMALLKGIVVNTKSVADRLLGTLKTSLQSNPPLVSATGSLAASGANLILPLDGMNTGVIQITGTFVGTIGLLGSVDNGLTYSVPLTVVPYVNGAQVSALSAPGVWELATGGLTHIQANMSAFTSGSASVFLSGTNGNKSLRVGTSPANPIANTEQPFQGAFAMAVGTTYTAGRSLMIVCTVAGNVNLTFVDGSTLVVPVTVGTSFFPGAITAVNSTSTTATATYYGLK